MTRNVEEMEPLGTMWKVAILGAICMLAAALGLFVGFGGFDSQDAEPLRDAPVVGSNAATREDVTTAIEKEREGQIMLSAIEEKGRRVAEEARASVSEQYLAYEALQEDYDPSVEYVFDGSSWVPKK